MCFRKVSKVFQVIRVFSGIILRGVLIETSNGDSRELQGSLKEVQRVFQKSFRGVLKSSLMSV